MLTYLIKISLVMSWSQTFVKFDKPLSNGHKKIEISEAAKIISSFVRESNHIQDAYAVVDVLGDNGYFISADQDEDDLIRDTILTKRPNEVQLIESSFSEKASPHLKRLLSNLILAQELKKNNFDHFYKNQILFSTINLLQAYNVLREDFLEDQTLQKIQMLMTHIFMTLQTRDDEYLWLNFISRLSTLEMSSSFTSAKEIVGTHSKVKYLKSKIALGICGSLLVFEARGIFHTYYPHPSKALIIGISLSLFLIRLIYDDAVLPLKAVTPERILKLKNVLELARPEGFEPPTT